MSSEGKYEGADLLNRYARWFERQTSRQVKKIVMDRDRKYVKAAKKLEPNGIEICATKRHIVEKNRRSDWMNCTIKYERRAILITFFFVYTFVG